MPSAFSRARRISAALAFGLVPALATATPGLAAVPLPGLPAVTPQGVVRGAGSPDAIAGKYLVVLKGDRPGVTAESLVGDKVGKTFAGLSAFSARISAVQARQLAADPAVAFVEQDRVVRINTDDSVRTESTTYRNPVWNLDRIDQRSATLSKTYRPTDDGSAVHAYVIDTGIRITHVELAGRASYGYDFVGNDSVASDCNGHGTHVAGTIGGTRYGVAKKVKLVAVRVLDCEGSGDLEGVVDGVNWVTQHAIKPAVANMSLGSSHSSTLDYAVGRSIASGVTYAVAAGNENENASLSSPADVPAAITVGATDIRDRRASFSNYGSAVDLFAPGVNVRSAYGSGDYMVAIMSGTSMASPAVAGAAALALDANPAWTPRTVRNYLVANATKHKVTKGGKGSPNRLLRVAAPPAAPVVRTKSLAAATLGVAYRAQLFATAGRHGTWRVSSGTLPAGLRLSRSGLIIGTPTAPGTNTVAFAFTDFVPTTISRRIAITVRATKPAIATASLPGGAGGDAYSVHLVSGGRRPGMWALAAGTLADGLTVSSNGYLTGTPRAAGSFSLTVRFTDIYHQSVVKVLPLTIDVGTVGALPDGVAGEAYDQTVNTQAEGSVWSLSTGTLPDGLTMASSGEITGVPTMSGIGLIRVTTTAHGITRVADYTITVD